MLFQSPPPTRFDLNFSIAGIPVRVHPLFWMIAVLLGSSSGGIAQLLIWVVVVFVDPNSRIGTSVFCDAALRNFIEHHPAFFRRADRAQRSLRWGSGLANIALTPIRNVISLAGPFSGFLFAALAAAGTVAAGGSVV